MEVGLVHIYHGNGKGKTTASMGLAVRAVGAGRKAVVAQFLKGRESGELASLKKLGIPVLRGKNGSKFVFQMDEAEKAACRQNCGELLAQAHAQLRELDCGLLVLDEVLDAVNLGMVEEEALLSLLVDREGSDVVLTGRDPSEQLQQQADYITFMQAQRHPYERGIVARQGIEY